MHVQRTIHTDYPLTYHFPSRINPHDKATEQIISIGPGGNKDNLNQGSFRLANIPGNTQAEIAQIKIQGEQISIIATGKTKITVLEPKSNREVDYKELDENSQEIQLKKNSSLIGIGESLYYINQYGLAFFSSRKSFLEEATASKLQNKTLPWGNFYKFALQSRHPNCMAVASINAWKSTLELLKFYYNAYKPSEGTKSIISNSTNPLLREGADYDLVIAEMGKNSNNEYSFDVTPQIISYNGEPFELTNMPKGKKFELFNSMADELNQSKTTLLFLINEEVEWPNNRPKHSVDTPNGRYVFADEKSEIVEDHAYTCISINQKKQEITLRQPWGFDITLSYEEAHNFLDSGRKFSFPPNTAETFLLNPEHENQIKFQQKIKLLGNKILNLETLLSDCLKQSPSDTNLKTLNGKLNFSSFSRRVTETLLPLTESIFFTDFQPEEITKKGSFLLEEIQKSFQSHQDWIMKLDKNDPKQMEVTGLYDKLIKEIPEILKDFYLTETKYDKENFILELLNTTKEALDKTENNSTKVECEYSNLKNDLKNLQKILEELVNGNLSPKDWRKKLKSSEFYTFEKIHPKNLLERLYKANAKYQPLEYLTIQ